MIPGRAPQPASPCNAQHAQNKINFSLLTALSPQSSVSHRRRSQAPGTKHQAPGTRHPGIKAPKHLSRPALMSYGLQQSPEFRHPLRAEPPPGPSWLTMSAWLPASAAISTPTRSGDCLLAAARARSVGAKLGAL